MREPQHEAWQEIAREDPEWAVLSLPQGKHGAWEPSSLRRTGEEAVARLLEFAERDVEAIATALAVDVGCGVGRLTAALADRFDRVVGIDVTPAMLDAARDRLGDRRNVQLVQADVARELPVEAAGADVVISERVLQHLPPNDVVAHVQGLVGLLRPGGVAILQVPIRLPWRVRLEPRRRAYQLGRRIGLSPRLLYWRLGLHPMPMHVVPVADVVAAVGERGRVVRVHRQFEPTFGVEEAVVVLRRGEAA